MKEKQRRKNAYPMARAWLSQVSTARQKLETLRQKRDNLRMLTTSISSSPTGMPRSDSPDLQRTQTLIAEIDAMEELILEAERELRRVKTEVGLTLCKLENPLSQSVLMLRYIDQKDWRAISGKLHYKYTQLNHYLKFGLAELESILASCRKSKDGCEYNAGHWVSNEDTPL